MGSLAGVIAFALGFGTLLGRFLLVPQVSGAGKKISHIIYG
jgi:hypothetical protein